MYRDLNGDVVMSWGEVADLTHKTQVDVFGWCSCEDSDGGYPFDDCTGGNDEA